VVLICLPQLMSHARLVPAGRSTIIATSIITPPASSIAAKRIPVSFVLEKYFFEM
jgi:hypothetical protein